MGCKLTLIRVETHATDGFSIGMFIACTHLSRRIIRISLCSNINGALHFGLKCSTVDGFPSSTYFIAFARCSRPGAEEWWLSAESRSRKTLPCTSTCAISHSHPVVAALRPKPRTTAEELLPGSLLQLTWWNLMRLHATPGFRVKVVGYAPSTASTLGGC